MIPVAPMTPATLVNAVDAGIRLQTTLSAASAVLPPYPTMPPMPHHPITCPSVLTYDEKDVFACQHAQVPGDDVRTRHCIDHSMALLIIELGFEL